MLPTRYGHTEFYSVAAQVMPVLLLAIVFEQRLFRRGAIPPLATAALSSVAIGSFVVAEAVSLRVLYRGYAHRQDQIWVIAPMLLGATLLVLPVVLPPLLDLGRAKKQMQSRLAVGLNIFVLVAVLGVLLALFKQ
jgi:hypothetical protein